MNAWMRRLFAAGQVNQGNVVRRNVADTHRNTTVRELKREVKRRGFHLVRTGTQYIVVCNKGVLRVLC